jgi:glycosyltransferase involved in cell wall biosynthesis
VTGGLPDGRSVAHLIETDGPGGAERVVVYLVSWLAMRGIDNVVLLPARGEGWLAAQLPQERVQVVPVPLLGVPVRTSFRLICDVLRAHQPAVAHSHEFTMGVLGGVAGWRLGIPHVLTMHGGRYYTTRLHRRLALALSATLSASVVAVSQTVAAQLAQDLIPRPRRMQLIPNGIPDIPDVPPALRQELGVPTNAKLIVTVGNLYAVKGHADLLKAFAAVASRVPWPLHLAIAGRGPEEAALRALARSLSLVDRFHLLGARDDIPNVLRSADVFVLPSHSEGLPLALLEAMRAGRPIVASAVGEIPTALQHGAAGLLTPPGDVSGLAAALRHLVMDPATARALAERARTIAAEQYTIERMAERYLALYQAAFNRQDAR